MTYFNTGYLMLLITLTCYIDYTIEDVQFQQHNGKTQGEVSDSETDLSDMTGNDIYNVQIYKRNSPDSITDIARFFEQSTKGTNSYDVYVDDTMTQLLITVISTKGTPLLNVTKPSGLAIKNMTSMRTLPNGSSIVTINIQVSQLKDIGIWSISRNDINSAEVKVQCVSPVSIQQSDHFFELVTNNAIEDRLFANGHFHMKVIVNGIGRVTNVTGRLYARNQRILKKIVTLKNTQNNVFENSSTPILDQPFYVGIEGTDNSGNTIQRLDPHLIEPISYAINLNPDSGAKVHENSTLNITCTIQCYTTRSIKVYINDTMGLLQSPSNVVSFSCTPGKNVTNDISLKAESNYGSTILTIIISHKLWRYYIDALIVHKTYTVVPTNLHEEDSNTDTPIAAIVGGVVGALLVLLAIVVAIIVYKKVVAKRNAVSQIGNNAMPTNTQYKTS